MTREEWKHIKGYEGLYEISTFGRVRKGNRYINPWVQIISNLHYWSQPQYKEYFNPNKKLDLI